MNLLFSSLILFFVSLNKENKTEKKSKEKLLALRALLGMLTLHNHTHNTPNVEHKQLFSVCL